MKKVEKITISPAHNGEHYDFMTIAIGIFNQSSAATLKLTAYYEPFHELYLQEDIAIKIIQRSVNTPAVQQFDKERIELYTYITRNVDMAVKHPDPVINQAAQRLIPVVKTYKGIYRMPQRDRSGYLANFVDDLKNPTNAPNITKLNLTASVNLLKTKNDLFIESYMGRAEENEIKKATEKMTSLRPYIDQAYNTCMEMLNVVYASNELKDTPDPAIRNTTERMILGLEANVQQMQLILSTRRHRAENKKKEE